jgi:sigma-B regulation protein RsbU (phosphoserine phosphatase)
METSVDKTPKVDFRRLMRKVVDVVEAIEPAEDPDRTVKQQVVEVVSRFREELGIFGGRVYARVGGRYRLIGVFPDSRAPGRPLEIPASYEPIQVLLDKRTLYMERDDPRLDPSVEEALGTKEFAAIEVGDQAYILAFDIEPGRDRDDVLISLVILRHALNQKLREERLEGVLREARRIQQSILPRRMPCFGPFEFAARTESMEVVGGDFYDFIPMTDKLLGVAVADVSGHGLPAALLVRDVHMGLRMGLSRDLKIVRTVERLDDIIHQSALTSRFVSMFYGELEPNGNFIYVNAGHPPPFYLAASGRVDRLTEGGPVLGPVPDTGYERGFVRLRPGDLVMLYTDGIIEAEDDTGREWRAGELIELLRRERTRPAAEIVDKVFTAVVDHTGGAPPHDDRTVVVIRYPG